MARGAGTVQQGLCNKVIGMTIRSYNPDFYHWYGYHIPWKEVEAIQARLGQYSGLEVSVALHERANELGIVPTIPLPDGFPHCIYD